MSGEVANISEVAVKVTKDIFKWFKWEATPVMDENFNCHKAEKHKPPPKRKAAKSPATLNYTHPVDVVFKYFDPYLNRIIMLNTDLKSYAKASINTTSVTGALESLAKTIDCARSSPEWQGKYILDSRAYEIRGLLFIYNHDNEYHHDFLKMIQPINTDKIGLQEGQVLHVLDALRIRYLYTVVADMKHLHSEQEFPINDYSFFYPDLYLHKSHGDPDNLPATIELLCSPYMIVKHGSTRHIDPMNLDAGSDNEGYVIYYNQDGSTEHEFRYLLDSLSRFQILRGKCSIKVRVAHHKPSPDMKSKFETAKNLYLAGWGMDSYKKTELERIEFEMVNIAVPNYVPGHLAWRYQ